MSRAIFQTWTANHIAEICGGDVLGDAELTPSGLINDSRKAKAGDAFVALVADRDGHDFIDSAREHGAILFIVNRGREPVERLGEAVVAVDDTFDALIRIGRAICQEHRQLRPDAVVLGITGSNGKTTTKELIAAILESGFPGQVLKTEGNLNNHIGLPITLCRLGSHHRFAVLEMGASVVGDIALLTSIAPLDRAVVTSIAPAHLEGFGTERQVIAEKGTIFDGWTQDGVAGVAVIPHRLRDSGLITDERGKAIKTFGVEDGSTVQVVDYKLGPPAWFKLVFEADPCVGALVCDLELALAGEHNAMNLAAAVALVWDLLPASEACDILTRTAAVIHPQPGRLVLKAGLNGARIFDDSYNANPASMRAALRVVSEQPGERWLIAGDMLELGPAARREHERVGELAVELGFRRVWAVGEWAETVVESARESGLSEVAAFETSDECAPVARETITHDSVVLVKGSRGVHLEHVVSALVAEEVD